VTTISLNGRVAAIASAGLGAYHFGAHAKDSNEKVVKWMPRLKAACRAPCSRPDVGAANEFAAAEFDSTRAALHLPD
jgi:hypothetical protein